MKKVWLVVLCFSYSAANAGDVRLEKLWQSDAVLQVPESVRYDADRKVLYTSNIAGSEPWADDGNGSIGKLDLDGNVIAAEWVTGLNGPKGIGLNGNLLYVTDNDDVVTIDIAEGKVIDRLEVPDAGTINDLSVAADGTIYITDSTLNRIHKVINGTITTVIEDLPGINGVLHSDGELLFAGADGLHIVGEDGGFTTIATDLEGRVDGIERVDKDSWLVSCWQGTVYHVTRNGAVTLLLDGRSEGISAADLGYDPVNRIAYFPGFWKNYVAAYRLVID